MCQNTYVYTCKYFKRFLCMMAIKNINKTYWSTICNSQERYISTKTIELQNARFKSTKQQIILCSTNIVKEVKNKIIRFFRKINKMLW